jgi:hypothetical protein
LRKERKKENDLPTNEAKNTVLPKINNENSDNKKVVTIKPKTSKAKILNKKKGDK